MESFKIDHFKKDNPSGEFPWHHPLSPADMVAIRHRLSEILQVSSESNLEIVNALYAIGRAVDEINADTEGFSLCELFKKLNISLVKNVYINWYRFDNIDEMRSLDLCSFFEDIWYPGPDDIDIFDSTLSWVLSVTHEGIIRVAKF